MERRGFIKVMAAGGCFALYPSFLSRFSTATAETQSLETTEQSGDIRLKLIATAMRAPNSHNIQPWLIRLTGEKSFELYVDQDRLLPHTDPPARQIHISQGAFLEYLRIAASLEGIDAKIAYFPKGIYSNSEILDRPVAAVSLEEDSAVRADELANTLEVRQSNKRLYTDRKIDKKSLEVLQQIPDTISISTVYSDDASLLAKLSPMLGKAMEIETSDPARHQENVNFFRFSEKEAIKSKDGFTLANNGVTGLKRMIAETFFLGTKEEAKAIDSSFAKEGVKMAHRQAESSVAYGWIVTDTNSRLDQLKVGELYSRINLMTAKLGIAQHPMSQILEEYGDMQELQKEMKSLLQVPMGKTVQMLYRMGYAEPVPPTKRRDVTSLV